MLTDTIAAIGTALSNSGISIIRISGDKSLEIINKIFRTRKKLSPNSIIYGSIYDDNNKLLDKVLISYFKSPNSFTGEDICEINCHGGVQITKQILELVLNNGARLAEPGEFSKRAFLNGKMDLTQAEAVIELINSKTKTQTNIFSRQLEGQLSNKVKMLRESLIDLLAKISVSIDYPEYDYEEVSNDSIKKVVNNIIDELNMLIDSYDNGKFIKSGINVSLIGKPNVGKSSLLNLLANYEKAIVTDIPGTTRDIIDETIIMGPLTLNISDTAGIRNTDDTIEKIGVERSIKKINESDLIIFLINSEENITQEEIDLISKIKNKGLKLITVINKIDKNKKSILDSILEQLSIIDELKPMLISVKENYGIENLKNRILELFNFNNFDFEEELIIMNERHRNILNNVKNILKDSIVELNKNLHVDMISISITKAASLLGQITGSEVSEDVINKIFEKFCLGK